MRKGGARPPVVWPGEEGWEEFSSAAHCHPFLWAQLIDSFVAKTPTDEHIIAAIAAGVEWKEVKQEEESFEVGIPDVPTAGDSDRGSERDNSDCGSGDAKAVGKDKKRMRGCSRFVHTVCSHCKRVEQLPIAERVLRLASEEDLTSVDEHASTVLHTAVTTSADMVELIVKLAPPSLLTKEDATGRTPLIIATARRKLTDATQVLLNAMDGEGLSIVTEVGMSALHQAVCSGPPDNVKAILDKMTDTQIVQKTGSGLTSLHLAALMAFDETIELLLARFDGDGLRMQTAGGRTALHLAVTRGDADIVRLIASAMPQADRLIKDNSGHTAWDLEIGRAHV